MSDVIGQKIKEIRPMTAEEVKAEGWNEDVFGNPTAIVLANGTVLYPSRDSEGNGGGALFGVTKKGDTFALYCHKQRSPL